MRNCPGCHKHMTHPWQGLRYTFPVINIFYLYTFSTSRYTAPKTYKMTRVSDINLIVTFLIILLKWYMDACFDAVYNWQGIVVIHLPFDSHCLRGESENVLKWKWSKEQQNKRTVNDIIIDGVASLVNAYIMNEKWKRYTPNTTSSRDHVYYFTTKREI